jgi:hypothetical protein
MGWVSLKHLDDIDEISWISYSKICKINSLKPIRQAYPYPYPLIPSSQKRIAHPNIGYNQCEVAFRNYIKHSLSINLW